MPSYEDLIRQNIGLPIQNQANQMGQQADAMAQQKLQALRQLGGSNPAPSTAPQMTIPPTPPIPAVQPNAPGMSQADQQSRARAMLQAPLTMQQVSAKLKAQADQDAADEASMQADQDNFNPSEYQDYPSKQKSSKFQQLKQKIQPKQDVRDTLHGAVEVTPELEKQLGYGSDDDEDEHAPQFSTPNT